MRQGPGGLVNTSSSTDSGKSFMPITVCLTDPFVHHQLAYRVTPALATFTIVFFFCQFYQIVRDWCGLTESQEFFVSTDVTEEKARYTVWTNGKKAYT